MLWVFVRIASNEYPQYMLLWRNIENYLKLSSINELPHDKTNKLTCLQRRHRSAWTSAQSDQGLRCPHEESLGPRLPIEHTAKMLIRLGECPD